MHALKGAGELLPGATILRDEAVQPRTGGWRTGLKPRVDLSRCVNCLLCWVYCPDSAVLVDGKALVGFDYRFCKGCEICEEMCPVDAVAMVDEATPLPEHGGVRGETDGDPQ